MTNILLDLIIILGCAIVFGLICVVLAFTWFTIKSMGHIVKEVRGECTPAKTAPIDMSDVTQSATNTNEHEKNTTK